MERNPQSDLEPFSIASLKLYQNEACDQNPQASHRAAAFTSTASSSTNLRQLFADRPIDVLVEATNSIGSAAEYCLAAFENNTHVVLMNAEVDLALGPLLNHKAQKAGVTITSDAGDQHGVLASLIAEAEQMGFDIIQSGNIKGFLDRYATPASQKLQKETSRPLNAAPIPTAPSSTSKWQFLLTH